MSKDYRKRKGSRAAKSNSTSSFAWAVFGILIGLFLAIMFYWHQTTPADSQHHPAPAKTAATTTTATAYSEHLAVTPKKPTAPATPEFDFYTVLPKMQVTPNNPTQVASPAARPPVASPPATVPVSATPAPATPTPAVAPTLATELAIVPTTTPSVTPLVVSPPPAKEVMPQPPTAKPAATAPTPTPVVATAPEKNAPEVKDTEPSSYLLQMASLRNYADADRLKAQLTMLGFDVYIQSYSANGQVYNRVVMGPYSSRTTAVQQQAQLQKNHVPSILIKAP